MAKAFDKTGNVLLCSSFSKTLAPGYRVGWIAAGRYQEQIERSKMINSVATPSSTQVAIAEFLATAATLTTCVRSGGFTLSKRPRWAMRSGVFFPPRTRVTRPQGGFVLWVELPTQIDALRLHQRTQTYGISIAPGHIFSIEGKFRNCIRLNAASWDPCVGAAIETLGNLAKQLLDEV